MVVLSLDLVVGSVRPEQAGLAAGMNETGSQFGFAFGIAALGTAFTVRAQGVLSDHHVPAAAAAARLVAGGRSGVLISHVDPSGRTAATKAVDAAAVAGVQNVLLVSGVVGVVAGVVVLFLVTRDRPRTADADAGSADSAAAQAEAQPQH
jgi:hypothetical protein